MPNYFYTDASGQRQGPINDQQLYALAANGTIGANTPLETDAGIKGLAGQIPGLNFQMTAASRPSSITSNDPLNRQTYIILALIGGWTGVHQFYAKRERAAIVNIVLSFVLMAFRFFASECQRWAMHYGQYERLVGQADFYMVAYYWWSFAFIAVLVAQIVLIIRAVAYNKVDGNGILMKE